MKMYGIDLKYVILKILFPVFFFFFFRFLQPVGHLANYFDSVFCNLRNNGLLCLTSSDISVQFTRTANVIRRYCHAQVTKTDYMREMAVRVIIGSAVRFVFACI